jgi:hypothetical protein
LRCERRSRSAGWLVGPWFDSLLIANLGWPLLLLWQVGEGFSGREGVQFWQIYFLTTPHRWITLAVVFLDREQLGRRRAAFLIIAAAVTIVCLGVRITTGALTCLLTIDYVWNAWHFASQHHGIYRIYTRRAGAGDGWAAPSMVALTVEKWSMRLFLLYVILRVAGAVWPYPTIENALQALDWAALTIPAWLLVRQVMAGTSGRASGVTFSGEGATVYLMSVCVLYVSLLAAVHFNLPAMVLSLATGSAVFHATEYLALVSWSMQGKRSLGLDRIGALGYFLPRWSVALALFMLVLGAGGWLLQKNLMQTWLLLNVIVAFLHYAYDGMIWKRA